MSKFHKLSRHLVAFFLILSMGLTLASVDSTVSSAASSPKVRLNVRELSMAKDSTYTLRVYNAKKNYKIYFSCDNNAIIEIPQKKAKTKKIRITALEIGTATITVRVKSKTKLIAKFNCIVTISPQAVSMKFLRSKLLMDVGTSQTIQPIIKPNTSQERPIYESSNPEVAIVNSKGRITALTTGQATITATLLSTGQQASYTVTIQKPSPPDPMPTVSVKEIPGFSWDDLEE